MAYGALLAGCSRAIDDEIMTMSPRVRVRIDGSTAWLRWWAPRAWVRTTRSSSSGSVSATLRPRLAMPALFTRMSTKPKSATAAATMARPSSRDPTSAG